MIQLKGDNQPMFSKTRFILSQMVLIFFRSFFPFATLIIILGTVLWGPWVSLALSLALWIVIDKLEIKFLASLPKP